MASLHETPCYNVQIYTDYMFTDWSLYLMSTFMIDQQTLQKTEHVPFRLYTHRDNLYEILMGSDVEDMLCLTRSSMIS